MRDLAQRLRALGFTVWRCRKNDAFIGYQILSSSGGPVHVETVASEQWAGDFLTAIDTPEKSG